MKKSELLALLKQDIKDAAGDLDLQAGMVLARVLSCGMLPPEAADFNIGNNWEPEEVEIPYGKSVVEQVNAEIKKLNGLNATMIIYDEAADIEDLMNAMSKKLLTAKEKLSNIE